LEDRAVDRSSAARPGASNQNPIVRIALGNGGLAYIEVSDDVHGREAVAAFADKAAGQFRSLADAICSVATDMKQAIEAAAPSEAEVEFGVEAKVESDGIAALFVKGEGSATFTVRLKWVRGDE
jgi:Trypsin-co-occurring domain 1